MSDDHTDEGAIVESEVSGSAKIVLRSPTARFTVSEYIDYHMILDQELAQLSRPEGGIFGSVGFTALGAALGFLPQAVATIAALRTSPVRAISTTELLTLILAPSCFACAVVCLVTFGIAKRRNSGTEAQIRARTKTTGQ